MVNKDILLAELGVIDELSVAAIMLICLFLIYIKIRQSKGTK